MIADITFLNTPYAYSSRQIPIGDLSEYEMHTVSNVKCSEDLVQSIAVPSFDDYSKANMVMINDEYYWVSGYRTKTYQEEVVIFDIVYNAVSSHLLPSTTLTGMFERVPLNLDKRMSFTIKDDAMVKNRSVVLGGIQGTRNVLYYVQITSSYCLRTPSKAGVFRYVILSYAPHKSSLTTFNNAVYVNQTLPFDGSPLDVGVFPTIPDIINNLTDSTGIPADSVIDISVSARNEFEIINRTVSGYKGSVNNYVTYNFRSSVADVAIPAYDTQIESPHIALDANDHVINFNYVIYELRDNENELYKYKDKTSVSITLTEKELNLGILNITDENGNIISTLPKELVDSNNKFTLEWETVGDFTGLYTFVYYADNIIRIPEGKLPWVGSNWSDYQIRSMSSDRAELNLSINSARDQRNIDLAEGAANAVVTGVIGGVMTGGVGAVAGVAQFAGSVLSAEAKGRLGERVAREEMNIRHGRVKDSAPTSFNIMYGTIYIKNSEILGGASLRLDMPSNTNDTEYQTYVNNWGYPCTGVKSFKVTSGYIKGMLTETVVPGLKGDLLNEELMKGVRILAKYSIIKTGNIAYKTGSTMNATVTYFRTSLKKGIIAFKGTFIGSGDMSTLEIVDVDKVTAILGITIKEQTYNLNGTWESQVPLSNEEHIKQVVVFGYHTQIGELDKVTSTFTPFNENTFNGKELYCYGIEVEEVEEV